MRSSLLRSRVRWFESGKNIVCDGNSITAGGQDGAGSNGGVMGQIFSGVSPLAPFSAHSYTNVAIGGQNTLDMINNRADVAAAFVPGDFNILFAQELTNSNSSGITAAQNTQLFLDYLAIMRSSQAWDHVVVATAPPAWLGTGYTQAEIDDWNARLDASNALLRQRYREQADALFETRQAGSPYAQSRYPDYLQATFGSATVVDGISNTATWTTEGAAIRIHYSAAGIAALRPLMADFLMRMGR